MIHVLHIIVALSADGAERAMLQLVSNMNSSYFSHAVVSLTGADPLGPAFTGVRVQSLDMRGTPSSAAAALPRLVRWIRKSRPDVVQTWMYHADLLGGLAARVSRRAPVLWNIRHGRLDPKIDKPGTIAVAHACARFSNSIPRHIVCCSQSSLHAHQEIGYAPGRMLVIPNGFDLERFKPSAESRAAVRQELSLADDDVAIGLVARYHPVKDHANFVAAAARLHRQYPWTRFVLCGDRADRSNPDLAQSVRAAGIAPACRLLGPRADMPRIYSALDLLVSSSSSEGFPNTVGEAMASGVPAVVTDVGESAHLVADTGIVVPPSDPEALARACAELTVAGPDARWFLGSLARRRIEERFSLLAVVERYQALYVSVVGRPKARRFLHPATAKSL